jgi:hypothetical protein
VSPVTRPGTLETPIDCKLSILRWRREWDSNINCLIINAKLLIVGCRECQKYRLYRPSLPAIARQLLKV